MKTQSGFTARARGFCLALIMTLSLSSAAWAACDSSSYYFGAGKYDITGPAAEQGMMGYAQMEQKSTGIHMRQWARAFNIKECGDNSEVLIVVADVGQLFESVRQGVLNKLETLYGAAYTYKNVMLSATHTHQGAGGYSHRDLYNLTTLGYSSQTYNAIVNGIVEAVKLAVANRQNNTQGTKIYWDRELAIDGALKGSFNRSLAAYNNNSVKFDFLEEYGGIDPYARQLTFIDNASGEVTGIINSFGVHPTTLGNTNKYLSSDSKGYSAWYTEQTYTNAVAAFPNGWDGDMSANFDGVPSNTDEDYEDMMEMGRLYADKAILMADVGNRTPTLLSGPVKYEARYVELPGLEVPAAFADDGASHSLCDPALGFSFAAGSTEDGEGSDLFSEGMVMGAVDSAMATLGLDTNFVESSCHAEKPVLLPTNVDVLGEITSIFNFIDGLGDLVADVLNVLSGGIFEDDSWTEIAVPIQLMQIGGVTIYPLPYESTVTAGAALQDKVSEITGESDAHLPIGLANSYVGYVTTRNEYEKQHYEGASVHFGPYTNNGFTYLYYRVAQKMINGTSIDDIAEASPEDLSDSLWDLQTEVVYDESPDDCDFLFFGCEETYGRVLTQPDDSYSMGDTVTVKFQSGHPKNDLQTMGTFLQVQKMVDGNWVDYISDDNPRTFYKWSRSGISESKAQIKWVTDSLFDEGGVYRIKHYGDYKNGFTGNIHSFSGTTNSFTLDTIALSLFTTATQGYTYDRDGNKDSAYQFDGANTVMKGEWTKEFDKEMTLSAWFKVDKSLGDESAPLIQVSEDTTWWANTLRYNSGGTMSAWCNEESAGDSGRKQIFSKGSGLNDGVWHHAAMVHKADIMYLYIDGERVGEQTNNCDNIGDAATISVGSRYNEDPNRIFTGAIDDVKVFDNALSHTEIMELADVDTVARFDFSGTANGAGYSDNISMTNNEAALTSDRAGRAESAYSFDGNDFMSGAWTHEFGDELTMSVWFRADPSDTDGGRLVEFFQGQNTWVATTLAYESDGQLMAWCQEEGPWNQNRGGQMYSRGSGLNDGEWHHAVVTFGSSVEASGMKLYVDGELVSSSTGYCSDIADASYISIGSPLSTTDGNKLFKGDIDDVKIYDKALTEDEVEELYSAAGFYQHTGYNAESSGYAVYLPPGEYTQSELESLGISNDLSSVKINNSGYQVVVSAFEMSGIRVLLRSIILSDSQEYLGDAGFYTYPTMVPLSIKIEKKSSDSAYVATFYEDTNYSSGSSYIWSLPPGEYTKSQLASYGIFDNSLSSLTISNNDYQVILYESDNFGGSSVAIDSSTGSLGSHGFNDKTSSLIIQEK